MTRRRLIKEEAKESELKKERSSGPVAAGGWALRRIQRRSISGLQESGLYTGSVRTSEINEEQCPTGWFTTGDHTLECNGTALDWEEEQENTGRDVETKLNMTVDIAPRCSDSSEPSVNLGVPAASVFIECMPDGKRKGERGLESDLKHL